MRYAQQKGGQKLHLVYELKGGRVTNPVCRQKVTGYRMTINVPLGNACKKCLKRISSARFDENKFLSSQNTQS